MIYFKPKAEPKDLSNFSQEYSFFGQKRIGILLIHGFSSTTSSMEYLAISFSNEGYDIELPLLAGHGKFWYELKNVDWHDWYESVLKAYNKLKERVDKVFLVGFSMGGALAIKLASLHQGINGLVLINHALYFRHLKYKLVPILNFFKFNINGIKSDLLDTGKTEIAYEKIPISAVDEFLKLLSSTKKDTGRVDQPVLIFKSVNDKTIPCFCAKKTLIKLSCKSKRIIYLKKSGHVAVMDFDKEIIVDNIIQFIGQNGNLFQKQ